MERLVDGQIIPMTSAEIAEFEASREATVLVPQYRPRTLIRVFKGWNIASGLMDTMDDVEYAEFTASAHVAANDPIVLRALALASRSADDLAAQVAALG